jgi:DNA-binding GntR family transcriptional regulator
MWTKTKSGTPDIYSRIVSDVVCGNIRPGERLGEDSLATRWKIGRGAVREAMFRLEQDGLLVRKAKVGTYIREIDDDELLEIYDIRVAIECLVIRRVAQVILDPELDELARLAESIDTVVDETSPERNDNDFAFHNQLCRISRLRHGPRLLRLTHLHTLCSRLNLRLIFLRGFQDQEVCQPDHRQIVTVLRRRDPDQAAEVVRRHLEEAMKLTLRDIETVKSRMQSVHEFTPFAS